MNPYLFWLLRISAVALPVTFLLSWHYEVRMVELTEHALAVDHDYPTPGLPFHYRDQMREPIAASTAAALFWGSVFHLATGALVGTGLFALVSRRRQLLVALGLDGGAARWRHLRRRHRLLVARHPDVYAGAYGAHSVLLMIAAWTVAALSRQLDTPYGLDGTSDVLAACAFVVVAASTCCLMKSAALSTRIRGLLGRLFSIVVYLILLGINGLAWILVGALTE